MPVPTMPSISCRSMPASSIALIAASSPSESQERWMSRP
jgi:hypothetical protein